MISVRGRSDRWRFGRRDFLRAAPVGLASGLWPASAEGQRRDPTGDVLGCAETLAGLAFSDADRAKMGGDVVRNRQRYAALRDVSVAADEHLTFAPEQGASVGDRIRVWPAHVDPTVAYHERLHLARGNEVVDVWEIDLRGW